MNNIKDYNIDDKHLCEIYSSRACDEFEPSDMSNKQEFSKKINLKYLVKDKNEDKSHDSPSEYSDVINWGNISLNNETSSSGKTMKNNTLPWRRWVSNKIKRKPKNNNNYLDKAPVTRKVWQE